MGNSFVFYLLITANNSEQCIIVGNMTSMNMWVHKIQVESISFAFSFLNVCEKKSDTTYSNKLLLHYVNEIAELLIVLTTFYLYTVTDVFSFVQWKILH